LVGIFSLGAITMAISLARFIVYSLDYDVSDADGSMLPPYMSFFLRPFANTATDLWCTAEMCTAVIVVSLPSLKSLIVRPSPNNTNDRSNSGYLQAGSGKTIGSRGNGHSSHVRAGALEDDEMELTFLGKLLFKW
jgi:hypothetical protein